MKRVGFCGFKQLEVGRKIPPCLRLGGVDNANGDVSTCDNCRDRQCDSDLKFLREDFQKENCDCHRTKGSLLNTIRRKWRRHKRSKRCDNRKRNDPVLNLCQNQDEVHDNCIKHQLLKNQKSSKSSGSSVPSLVNRGHYTARESETRTWCSNFQKESKPGRNEDNEDCSCFGSPTRKTFSNITAKVVKLKTHASKSMSDISSVAIPSVSSPTLKTDSENDICRISSIANSSTSRNDASYSSSLCLDVHENGDSSFAQEVSNDFQPGPKFGNLTQELYKLSKYGWYWGPINRSEAESKLVDQPDGAFLVRDSSDDRYILSLSFRSNGKTLHTRIEHSSGLFSFYSQPEPEGHASIVELIKQSMCYSQSGVFCYSRSRSPGSPSVPVRLMKPISRFTQVRSLQYLCRFVIRQYTRYDHIQKLPLPQRIKGYLEEGHY